MDSVFSNFHLHYATTLSKFNTSCIVQAAMDIWDGDSAILTALARRQSMRPSVRMAIKVKGKILFIDPGDVVAIVAEGNYVMLQQESISYLLREPISVVAKKLEPFGFIRIHRSVLVNASFVEELKPYPTGEYGLRVKGGKEFTATRTYKENLRSLAEFSIGTGGFFLNREP